MKHVKKITDILKSISLLIIYICVQYIFADKLSVSSIYFTYYFDLGFIIVTWIIYPGKISFTPIKTRRLFSLVLFLISGILIHLSAIKLHFKIPFEFSLPIVILFLLFIGPILEELIFRYAFWEISKRIYKRKYFEILFTAAMFSFSHLYAFWVVTKELQTFVLFQTVYTFFLGLILGFYRHRYDSIIFSILAHMAFNLGFYLVAVNL